VLDYAYVSYEEFRQHPHYLDLENLLVGRKEELQKSTVREALLFASTWADSELDMPLGAHVHTEYARCNPDRQGRIKHHPEHAPVIKVAGLATGLLPDDLDDVTSPQVWLEQQGRMIIAYGPSGPTLSTLQFGGASGTSELLTRWTYVAGWPATQLGANATAGTSTLTVGSTVGMLAGTVLRLWTPGLEEAVTVASVTGLTTIELTSPILGDHQTGMSCSALPPDARMAVIKMAVAKLLRKGPLAESAGRFGSKAPSPHASAGDPRRTTASNSYHDHACGLLSSYKRIR
jgi:hypothetical protein